MDAKRTNIVIVVPDPLRPLEIGDLVSDQTDAKRYGIITALIDATHATVTPLGILSGLPGHGWWTTATTINAIGQTTVTVAVDITRDPQIGDFVSDESSALRFGQITAVHSPTSVDVTPLGALRGLAGFGWWTTATPIARTGTTNVVLATGPDRLPQINDLVVDETSASGYGEITTVTDSTHVTVTYIGALQGPAGIADLGAFDYIAANLAPGSAYQGQMAGQPAMVGAFTVTVSAAAWVRVYSSQAHMVADQGRGILSPLDISTDHGCYLDFVGTASELVKTLTPGVQITDLGTGVWLSVVNTSAINLESVAVHFDYRTFRG